MIKFSLQLSTGASQSWLRVTSVMAFAMSSLACSGAPPEPVERGASSSEILGGQVENGEDAVVALVTTAENGRTTTCTGEVIAPRVVLTAAHCVHATFLNLAFFNQWTNANIGNYTRSIRTGVNANAPARSFEVAQAYYHSAFDQSLQAGQVHPDYDIAYVVLREPIQVAPATIYRGSADALDGRPVRVVGYGQTVDGDNGSVGIKNSGPSVITRHSPLQMIVRGQASQCHGDSGGPAFIDEGGKPQLAAITSSTVTDDGTQCHLGLYNTRLDVHLGFIDEALQTFGDGVAPAPEPPPQPAPPPPQPEPPPPQPEPPPPPSPVGETHCGTYQCGCNDGSTTQLAYCGPAQGESACRDAESRFTSAFPGISILCRFQGGLAN